jgi:hypothetical protein
MRVIYILKDDSQEERWATGSCPDSIRYKIDMPVLVTGEHVDRGCKWFRFAGAHGFSPDLQPCSRRVLVRLETSEAVSSVQTSSQRDELS